MINDAQTPLCISQTLIVVVSNNYSKMPLPTDIDIIHNQIGCQAIYNKPILVFSPTQINDSELSRILGPHSNMYNTMIQKSRFLDKEDFPYYATSFPTDCLIKEIMRLKDEEPVCEEEELIKKCLTTAIRKK